MPVDFRCPYCGLETEVDDQYIGQSGACAGCGKTITVPASTQRIEPPAARAAGGALGTSAVLMILAGIAAVAVILLAAAFLVRLLSPAVELARSTAQQSQCSSNLRRIALAMEAYRQTYNAYPPAYLADEQGRPMHSWRVLLLPFLKEDSLYSQYNFDLPWNDPVNMALATRMPAVYGCPADTDNIGQGDTSYMVVTGSDTLFPLSRSREADEIRDPGFETILVVETRPKGVCWLNPTDIPFSQMNFSINGAEGPAITSVHPGGAHVACADGQCYFLGDETPPEHVRAMLTASGDELVPDNVTGRVIE